ALLDAPRQPHPGISLVKRAQWKARPSRTERLTHLKGAWSRITVHHSDESKSSQTGGTLEDSQEVVRAIQKFHMDDAEHGWGDIGYHFLIDSAGRIFEGRPLEWQGAHAGGAGGINNQQNIGICMLGDFLRRPPTPAALKSLELLIDSLSNQYKIPGSRVYPHSHFTTTQCPGPALTGWLKTHYR
ncbi:MAG: peptidoglycan recognition family protein, partial [Planctomycetota bacterium]